MIPEYLYYYLTFEKGQKKIKDKITGSAQPGINSKFVKNFYIKLPKSIQEQQKIASILENLDNNLDKTQEIIEKYEMMKQGLMHDLIFKNIDEFIELGNLISLEYGKNLPDDKRSNSGFPVFGSNGIVGYHDSYLIKNKGIIVGRKGTIGKVSFSDGSFWPIDTTYYVEFKKEMDLFYTYYLLSSLDLKKLDSSTGVPGLNRNDAYELKVINKPLNEQKEISEVLNSIGNKIMSEQKYLSKLQKIKTGFMQNLLTGKVRVKT